MTVKQRLLTTQVAIRTSVELRADERRDVCSTRLCVEAASELLLTRAQLL